MALTMSTNQPNVPDKLRSVLDVFQYLNLYDGMPAAALQFPEIALWRCVFASRVLADFLKNLLPEAQVDVCNCYGLKQVGAMTLSPFPAKKYHIDWSVFAHSVVRCDDLYIDITARQLCAETPFPYVLTDAQISEKWDQITIDPTYQYMPWFIELFGRKSLTDRLVEMQSQLSAPIPEESDSEEIRKYLGEDRSTVLPPTFTVTQPLLNSGGSEGFDAVVHAMAFNNRLSIEKLAATTDVVDRYKTYVGDLHKQTSEMYCTMQRRIDALRARLMKGA